MRLIRRCSLKRAWLGSAWPTLTCWRQGWSTPTGPRAGGRPWPTCPNVRNGPQDRAGRHPAHALRPTRRHLTMTEAVSVSALVKPFGRVRALDGLDPARKAELLELFELDPTKRARTNSKGNRRKVALDHSEGAASGGAAQQEGML